MHEKSIWKTLNLYATCSAQMKENNLQFKLCAHHLLPWQILTRDNILFILFGPVAFGWHLSGVPLASLPECQALDIPVVAWHQVFVLYPAVQMCYNKICLLLNRHQEGHLVMTKRKIKNPHEKKRDDQRVFEGREHLVRFLFGCEIVNGFYSLKCIFYDHSQSPVSCKGWVSEAATAYLTF